MKRTCPRTLDKPVLLFGLEMEEVSVIALITGLASLIIGPIVPGIGGITAWIALIQFKKDKPEGYLLHQLYFLGLPLPGLVPSPNNIRTYAIR